MIAALIIGVVVGLTVGLDETFNLATKRFIETFKNKESK